MLPRASVLMRDRCSLELLRKLNAAVMLFHYIANGLYVSNDACAIARRDVSNDGR
jgi:hypothetical protein